MRKVDPVMKRALVAHHQFRHVGYFIRRARAARGAFGEHVLIKISPRPVEFVQRQGRDDNARRNGVEPSPRLTHSTAWAITRFSLQRLAS